MNTSISSIQRWVTQYKKERQGITPKNSALTPEQKRVLFIIELNIVHIN